MRSIIEAGGVDPFPFLGAVKTQFGRFGELLRKVKKTLDETGNTIGDAIHRSRQIERKLRKVEALPAEEATSYFIRGARSGLDRAKRGSFFENIRTS